MAEVWAAEQHGEFGFGKLVALKMIRSDAEYNQTFRAMFVDEALIASQIKHPNVVETLDLGSDDGVLYHAMTLVEGCSLSEWALATERRFPISIALRIMIDVLTGLDAAHELTKDGKHVGLVHRDVSPQNVIVGVDGVARVADFGIARTVEACCVEDCIEACCSRRAAYETSPGRVRGKIGYLAPELLDGKTASRASDVYAAGVVLWELLTGERLFDVSMENATRTRRQMQVRDPREIAAELPAPLATAVMRALAEDPAHRFETAHDMATALADVAWELAEDADYADVAALLEADMGVAIREKSASIEGARHETCTPLPASSGVYAREDWSAVTTAAARVR